MAGRTFWTGFSYPTLVLKLATFFCKWHATINQMLDFIKLHRFLFGFTTIIIIAGAIMGTQFLTRDKNADWVTATVIRTTVNEVIAVSGSIESSKDARLSFPTSGIVSRLYFKEGDTAQAGDVVATLGADGLVAERLSALANLRVAQVDRNELLAGLTLNQREVSDVTVAIATEDLERIKKSQEILVENARRNLLNTNITALAGSENEEAEAPVISGTYTCEEKGTYILKPYASAYTSGYSFVLSGLERGTFSLSTNQPLPFGNCGLFAQFDPNSRYSNSQWTITIPNQKSNSYTSNANAYEKAQSDAKNAIGATTQSLTLASSKQNVESSAPRSEAVARADARIAQASAQVAQIDARIKDRSIIAPFTGTITNIMILEGETTDLSPVLTLIATDDFEIIARIPELDVTKMALGQTATVVFDAKLDAPQNAAVTFISPVPTSINGVAYFKITLKLNTIPDWIRSGLSADVDIITDKRENVLTLPKRFVSTSGSTATVLRLVDDTVVSSNIKVLFSGSDGLVEISGLEEGTVVVAP